jgi:hypothetical protein
MGIHFDDFLSRLDELYLYEQEDRDAGMIISAEGNYQERYQMEKAFALLFGPELHLIHTNDGYRIEIIDSCFVKE